MKKSILFLTLALLLFSGMKAQTYQSEPDKMWGRYVYREHANGDYIDALTQNSTYNSLPASSDYVLAYYYRIPSGHVRADMFWRPKIAKQAKLYVTVSYPQTGQILYKDSIIGPLGASTQEISTDLFGDINFPADDFYRVELRTDNWSNFTSINYFNYYHENELPVLIPRNFGGTSAYLGSWSSSHPDAPSGRAYDWAYIESLCEKGNQYQGTYYMTMGNHTFYMGMQTNGRVSQDVFNRNVLFSIWDDGNTDLGYVPEWRQSKVLKGNNQAVQTHAGGEGSSASVMFQNNPIWWADGHWVQFLLNTRPITTPITVKSSSGRDSTFDYGYTIMTAWYKLDTMPDWRYMATIRAAGICEDLDGWYQFIEPFTSAAGQKRHRVYHRHGALRSANSGRWYNANKIGIGYDGNVVYRDYHCDFGRGASQKYDNCFRLEMGGYTHQEDSSEIVPLAKDMSFVDTINLDRLTLQVDSALQRDDYYNLESRLHQTAALVPPSTWSIITSQTTGYNSTAANAVDGDENTKWQSYSTVNTLGLSAQEEQTLTSFEVYWTDQYNYRARFVDVYTSEDGQNWTLRFDSLEVRCLDRIEVSLPEPVTTRYLRLNFHTKYTSSNSLHINELTFRGAYDLDSVKALARTLIDNSGTINNYSEKDLEGVIAVYDNGNCTDAQALADAISSVSKNGNFARNYLVVQPLYLAADHQYFLKNVGGNGVLSADTLTGRLTLQDADVEGAQSEFTGKAEITAPQNNWLILHDEKYTGYYLYNVGVNKYFNPQAAGYLSDEPATIQFRSWGRSFYIATSNGRQNYDFDATRQSFFSQGNSVNNNSLFYVYDVLRAHPAPEVLDSVKAKTDSIGKLNLYKEGITQMLNAPVGVVGGFTSEEARQALQMAYDDVNTDPKAFVNAVERADVIDLDFDNGIYTLEAADSTYSSAPYITADAALRLNMAAADNNPDQIWRFQKKNGGYALWSQGVTMRPVDQTVGKTVTTTATPALGGTYAFSERNWGRYYIGAGDYAQAVLSAAQSPVRTDAPTSAGSTWYIRPATSATISLNSTGLTSTYYDYGYYVPEGVTAYAIDSVTPTGVIKLRQIADTVPPRTAVILQGDAYGRYDVGIFGGSDTLGGKNLLRGVFFRSNSLQKGTYMVLGVSSGKAVMRKPALNAVSANTAYLPITDDMPGLSSYTFDFDDIIDGITTATTQAGPGANMPGSEEGATYTLDGRRAVHTVKGNIYIRNHKKILEQ